jgi:hypothetical protein
MSDQLNDIQIPDKADKVVNSAIRRGRRTLAMRRTMCIITGIFVFSAVLFGGAYASPAIAASLSKVPFVGSIFKEFSDEGIKAAKEKGLTKALELEVTKGDATVAIKEVYYDKSRISLGLVTKGIKPYEETITELYYGDRRISEAVLGIINERPDDLYYVTFSADIPEDLPDKFDMKVVIGEDWGQGRKFEFMVPLDRTLANQETKQLFVMKEIETNEGTMFIKKLQFTPSVISVEYECDKLLYEPDISLRVSSTNGETKLLKKLSTSLDHDESRNAYIHNARFEPVQDMTKEFRVDIIGAGGKVITSIDVK